jgi:tetratricopeptide (TPR) repeat protein
LIWKLAQQGKLDIEIPSNIQVVLEQRLRPLNDDLRKMVTFAAVEGEEFTAQVLTALSQCPEYDVYDRLEALEHRYHFIQEHQEQDTKELGEVVLDIYRFMHRFYRNYVYEQLSAGKKRFLHRAIGDCLEKLYEQNIYQIVGPLAIHFRAARQPKKAAKYALMAAQFEHTHYAWTDCRRLVRTWIDIIRYDPPDDEIHNLRLDLLDLSGDGYYKSGKYSQADQRYRTALNIAQEIQAKPEQIAELCAELADTCEGEGRIDEVNEFVERGQRILQEHAETIAYSEIHVKLDWMYGVILWRKGEPKTVAEFLPKLITDAESLPQTVTLQYIIARIHNLFGSVLSGLCDYDAAIIHFQKAIKQLNEIGEKGLAAGYSVNLANTFKKNRQI